MSLDGQHEINTEIDNLDLSYQNQIREITKEAKDHNIYYIANQEKVPSGSNVFGVIIEATVLMGKISVFLALLGVVLYQMYKKTQEPINIILEKTREEKDLESFLNQTKFSVQVKKPNKPIKGSLKELPKKIMENKSNFKACSIEYYKEMEQWCQPQSDEPKVVFKSNRLSTVLSIFLLPLNSVFNTENKNQESKQLKGTELITDPDELETVYKKLRQSQGHKKEFESRDIQNEHHKFVCQMQTIQNTEKNKFAGKIEITSKDHNNKFRKLKENKVSFVLEPTKTFYVNQQKTLNDEQEPADYILDKCDELKELKCILTMNKEVKPKLGNALIKSSIDTQSDIFNKEQEDKKVGTGCWNSHGFTSSSGQSSFHNDVSGNKSNDYNNIMTNTLKHNQQILQDIAVAKRRMSYVSLNPNMDSFRLDENIDHKKSKRRHISSP